MCQLSNRTVYHQSLKPNKALVNTCLYLLRINNPSSEMLIQFWTLNYVSGIKKIGLCSVVARPQQPDLGRPKACKLSGQTDYLISSMNSWRCYFGWTKSNREHTEILDDNRENISQYCPMLLGSRSGKPLFWDVRRGLSHVGRGSVWLCWAFLLFQPIHFAFHAVSRRNYWRSRCKGRYNSSKIPTKRQPPPASSE